MIEYSVRNQPRIEVIYNPCSGDINQDPLKLITQEKSESRIVVPVNDIRSLNQKNIDEIANRTDVIIIVGGDGTIASVIRDLSKIKQEIRPKIVSIPTGSVNVIHKNTQRNVRPFQTKPNHLCEIFEKIYSGAFSEIQLPLGNVYNNNGYNVPYIWHATIGSDALTARTLRLMEQKRYRYPNPLLRQLAVGIEVATESKPASIVQTLIEGQTSVVNEITVINPNIPQFAFFKFNGQINPIVLTLKNCNQMSIPQQFCAVMDLKKISDKLKYGEQIPRTQSYRVRRLSNGIVVQAREESGRGEIIVDSEITQFKNNWLTIDPHLNGQYINFLRILY